MDGFSDDVLSLLRANNLLPRSKVLILAGADCPAKQEARQLSLGADCVLRDPLRPEVLSEYLAKFLRQAPAQAGPTGFEPRTFELAGAMVSPAQQQIQFGGRLVHVSPKEAALARLLADSEGKILTYDQLYDELFQRSFGGESANFRVLLGKLAGSFRKLGLDLRSAIRVTPKTGCTYLARSPVGLNGKEPKKKPRPKSRL